MGNTLRLTYWGGHPVFDGERSMPGSTLTLDFWLGSTDDIDGPLVRFTYSLRLSPDGCSIEKHVCDGYDGGPPPADAVSWSEHDPMILEMAKRINLAISKGDTMDLSAFTDIWSERGKDIQFNLWGGMIGMTSAPDLQKQPILNDYGIAFWVTQPIPETTIRRRHHLRLTFLNGNPAFDGDGLKSGTVLHLNFGLCLIDDINFPFITYHVWVSPDGCSIEKSVTTGGWYGNHWVTGETPYDAVLMAKHDPMIVEMAQRINLAIGRGDTLDLSEFLDFWSDKDRQFNFGVGEGSSSLVSRGFQKMPIPNDCGIDFWEAVPNSMLPESKKDISRSDDGWDNLEKYARICYVRLTFREGHPVFESKSLGFGCGLTHKFGICLIGDVFIPLITYTLLLSPNGCSIEKHVSDRYNRQNSADAAQVSEHDPMILEMAQRINLAIGNGETLDLSADLDFWSQKDNHFCPEVGDCWYLWASSPDYQKKPIPNDSSIDFWEAVPSSLFDDEKQRRMRL